MRASRPFDPETFEIIGIIMDKERQTQGIEIEEVEKGRRKTKKQSMVIGVAGNCQPLRGATVG